MDNLNLNEYYDSEYTETESECLSSENEIKNEEVTYVNDIPLLMIMDTADIPNDFIITFSDFLRQDGDVNNNFISAFFN